MQQFFLPELRYIKSIINRTQFAEKICSSATDGSITKIFIAANEPSNQQLRRRNNTSQQKANNVFHQLSPSDLRSARIALYSIMQQLLLPEFRYIKGSTTPEDSISNLPVDSSSRRIKNNSHLLSLSPFFDEDNVICVGGRLANSPYSLDKKFPIMIPKTSPLAGLLIREGSFGKPSQWTTDDLFCPPNRLDSWRNCQC